MELEITKACADSLRAFTQSSYGIQLKSSHAHELVAAYFGYSSRAALLADKKYPIGNLIDAEIIILDSTTLFVDQRIKNLDNFPSALPDSFTLAEGVYAPLIDDSRFYKKIWPGFREVGMAFAEERGFEKLEMFGMGSEDMDWKTEVIIKTTESGAQITATFDYPKNAKKPLRYSKVDIALHRIAGSIGFDKAEVMPTFYSGNMSYPDFRLKHGID